ncbi:D-Ala-D-Ala carboxypeptidase family metallohydrolase [Bordetella genomosp. 13]|uniref:D-Ala-D-Ala carboxypeptidase family metallohydrolase n=1 Tax=Bordetella genomosp. 13 TaxID=463040 RepID=UPI0011A956E4|nr:D-Ala-D-Ala carboxypeptidase family metallohydrolase [Bordetella genomosp. 13]
MNLSPHFALAELVASQTAERRRIDNIPTDVVLSNLYTLADRLETVRGILGGLPMLISSGYRSQALNRALGGSITSAHMLGLAADFTCPGFGSPLDVCRELARHADALDFDQIIHEGTWVHLGLAAPGKMPLRQVLTAHFNAGGTTYSRGL